MFAASSNVTLSGSRTPMTSNPTLSVGSWVLDRRTPAGSGCLIGILPALSRGQANVANDRRRADAHPMANPEKTREISFRMPGGSSNEAGTRSMVQAIQAPAATVRCGGGLGERDCDPTPESPPDPDASTGRDRAHQPP
jgi:hypothetical protein